MSFEYAVLWSIEEPRGFPIGLAGERGEYVLVDLPEHLCVPARYRGEYRVMQPDGEILTYRPGSDGYFDQVLLELSRTFAIGERGLYDGTPETFTALATDKVHRPIRETTVGTYSPRYGAQRYRHEERPDPTHAGPMVIA